MIRNRDQMPLCIAAVACLANFGSPIFGQAVDSRTIRGLPQRLDVQAAQIQDLQAQLKGRAADVFGADYFMLGAMAGKWSAGSASRGTETGAPASRRNRWPPGSAGTVG